MTKYEAIWMKEPIWRPPCLSESNPDFLSFFVGRLFHDSSATINLAKAQVERIGYELKDRGPVNRERILDEALATKRCLNSIEKQISELATLMFEPLMSRGALSQSPETDFPLMRSSGGLMETPNLKPVNDVGLDKCLQKLDFLLFALCLRVDREGLIVKCELFGAGSKKWASISFTGLDKRENVVLNIRDIVAFLDGAAKHFGFELDERLGAMKSGIVLTYATETKAEAPLGKSSDC
jgi:hypothetical protein